MKLKRNRKNNYSKLGFFWVATLSLCFTSTPLHAKTTQLELHILPINCTEIELMYLQNVDNCTPDDIPTPEETKEPASDENNLVSPIDVPVRRNEKFLISNSQSLLLLSTKQPKLPYVFSYDNLINYTKKDDTNKQSSFLATIYIGIALFLFIKLARKLSA